MRAPISIIIPTLDAEQALPACLGALGEGLSAGVIRELILSDGGSTDGTLAIAASAGAEVVRGGASRGGQLARGAAAAGGDWLLFLHADTVLDAGWSTAVRACLDRPGAYHFRLRFDAPGVAPRIVAGWANLRSRLFALPYGDQGLLIHRRVYDAIGGFPDIPLMEDVALARRARGQLRALRVDAITSAEKYERQGWLRRGGRNLLTLLRYFMGVNPERLARRYRA
ncbi:TIGR04283 family arsenosugar biosynthesis glycosyltransferase [Primorskyibacter sp. 2E107]|uniref:TIGR04283 family arsenosugar biosynthesis glycosyltransferase n=1 Tax=Primorskyibacter sp. 2E107 TaxID=3403458 RepID=UPI003AF6E826